MSSIKSNFEDLKLKAYDVYKKNDKPTKYTIDSDLVGLSFFL